MSEIIPTENDGVVVLKFINKFTKKMNECEFNVNASIPGIYPAIKEIISCFAEYGMEIHNYTELQNNRFQRAILNLTKEFTEFFASITQMKGANKKELLIMLTMDIFKTEINLSNNLTMDQKQTLNSPVMTTIFEDILSKTITTVLVFKEIVNEEFSKQDFRSCFSRWFCCFCSRKKKLYLK